MRLYLGNKMVGISCFNAPWFDETAAQLRYMHGVTEVFNPADHDRAQGFDPMKCPRGTAQEAMEMGFVRRNALRDDWTWIAENSDGMVAGPQWLYSTGTISEVACHQALGLPVWESDDVLYHGLNRNYALPALLTRRPEPLRF